MHSFPLFWVLFALPCVLAQFSWPNSFPKQINAIRRRSGLTRREYLTYHTLVHGAKSWNEPDDNNKPVAYIQDHAFDSVFGLNSSTGVTPSYSGRDDLTELYSKTESSFISQPLTNYAQTVIGPDGANFNDEESAFSMYATETFEKNLTSSKYDRARCPAGGEPITAFYWLMASSPLSNTSAFDNSTFASNIMRSLLAFMPDRTIYNASTHISIPGVDSRQYYGGFGLPTVNAVLKFWLWDSNQSVTNFRTAQKALENAELGINLDASFVVFARQVVLWDLVANVDFDPARLQGNLAQDNLY